MWGEEGPICGICRKRVTWTFNVCEECQQKYGRATSDRDEWANEMIRWEANRRTRMTDNNRVKAGKEEYVEDIADWETGFSYTIDFETIIIFRALLEDYVDSDGWELQDSDWDAVYSYGVY